MKIKESFEKEGYTLLTKEYKNAHTYLEFICPKGHHHRITWNAWKQGIRCGKCTNRYNIDYDVVNKSFVDEGYTLLTKEYKNAHTYLEFICPKGHHHRIRWGNWKQGQRCKDCKLEERRININDIKKELEKEGYTLLTKEYKNNRQYLEFICPKGHHHRITWNAWKQGIRCGKCSINKRLSIDEIRDEFSKESYELKTLLYINNQQYLEFVCPNGHRYKIQWNAWKQGSRCGKCSSNYIDDEQINNLLHSVNYTLLTKHYNNSKQLLTFKCEREHIFETTWNSFQQGSRCPHCYSNRSIEESKIAEFCKSFFVIKTTDKRLIKPYELDIIISEKNTAIEYCGLYWHSELQGKGKNYHLNKLKLCNDKGYRLITIFEDEWLYYNNVVKSRLLAIFGILNNSRIHARQCNIKYINRYEAFTFLSLYHLQGFSNASIKLGAFYNEELVAVMTFSRPSIAKGSKNQDFWEINRFCSHPNYHIPGIASKLLTYFERNYEWYKIVSYADRRWSEGNLYYKIGFNLVGETKPNYWYIDKKHTKRIHRFAFRKKPDEPKDKTERELRQEQGYDRIWDCGSLKFEKFNLR